MENYFLGCAAGTPNKTKVLAFQTLFGFAAKGGSDSAQKRASAEALTLALVAFAEALTLALGSLRATKAKEPSFWHAKIKKNRSPDGEKGGDYAQTPALFS